MVKPNVKRLFFDVETTGTNWYRHGIHQLSGIIDIDGVYIDSFNIKLQPHPNCEILDSALAVAGVTREDIAKYQTQAEGFKEFLSFLAKYCKKFDKEDKINLVGFRNSSFDNFFLRLLFDQCGDKYYGSWFYQNTVDVATLASEYFLTRRSEIENFKLSTISKYFMIDVDETRLHDALYDVELTREVYYSIPKGF